MSRALSEGFRPVLQRYNVLLKLPWISAKGIKALNLFHRTLDLKEQTRQHHWNVLILEAYFESLGLKDERPKPTSRPT